MWQQRPPRSDGQGWHVVAGCNFYPFGTSDTFILFHFNALVQHESQCYITYHHKIKDFKKWPFAFRGMLAKIILTTANVCALLWSITMCLRRLQFRSITKTKYKSHTLNTAVSSHLSSITVGSWKGKRTRLKSEILNNFKVRNSRISCT